MNPENQLQVFISEFTPEIAELAAAVLCKMRTQFPHAVQLVYDNYNALVIGFGPTERASDAIFSIALYPRRVSLCFLQGGLSSLKDPAGLLQGSGKINRFIPLESAATLDDPRIQHLMEQAIASATAALNPSETGYLVVKSVSAKQRHRRPVETK